jgi:hypothetical protein
VLAVLAFAALLWSGCGTGPEAITAPTSVENQETGVLKAAASSDSRKSFEATFRERLRQPQSDEFTITNTSDDGVRITEVVVDLHHSAGDVFFDTLPGGPGVGEFFVLKTNNGWDVGLTRVEGVNDGSTSIRFTFDFFDPGKTFTFYIDVDELATGVDGMLVSGAEFAGSTLKVRLVGGSSNTTIVSKYRSSGAFKAKAVGSN